MQGHQGAQENVLHCSGRAMQAEREVLAELLTLEKTAEGGDRLVLTQAESAPIETSLNHI